MGDEDGFGFGREGLLYFVGANVVRLGVAVDEHGHERILEYRVYRRRKARGDRDYLVARFLAEKLAGLEEFIALPKAQAETEPSWFGFLISVRAGAPFSKRELVEYLEENGVGTRQLFAGNILRQPMITESGAPLRIGGGPIKRGNELGEADYALLPGTEAIMNNSFWVGCFPGLGERELSKTAAAIRAFAESKSK